MRRAETIRHEPPDPGELYEREGPRLWRAVLAYSQDRAVTDDAVAEAFAQCIRRGRQIRDPRSWVWTTAFRLAAAGLKERGRRVPLLDDRTEVEDPAEAMHLLAALGLLPRKQRAALVLRFYAGYGTDEIARLLGCSRATVRVHISRGRHRLRELLEG
ncbi:MAG: RNA polymerase [Actinomycetota bacterium]|nr:MAG: RNA polymerase [Actinomycetota bacterium]